MVQGKLTTWVDIVKTPASPPLASDPPPAASSTEYAVQKYDPDYGEEYYEVDYERLGWVVRGARLCDFLRNVDCSVYNEKRQEFLDAYYDNIVPTYSELLTRVWNRQEFQKFRAADNDSNEFWKNMDYGEEWTYETHLEKVAENGLKELFDQFRLLSKCYGRFMRNQWNEDCYRHAALLKTDHTANKPVLDAMELLKREFLRLTNNKCSHCCKTIESNCQFSSSMCATCGLVMCDDCMNYESDQMGSNCVFCISCVI